MLTHLLLKISSKLGVEGSPWLRRIVLPLLLAITVLCGYLSFGNSYLPIAGPIAIIAPLMLAVFLCMDSASSFFSVMSASRRGRIELIRRVDQDIDRAIMRAEDASIEIGNDPEAVGSIALEFQSDFESGRPFRRLFLFLFLRTAGNFMLSIFCFSAAAMSLASWSVHLYQESPYKHSCFSGSYPRELVHFFYYHAVIFQSLGDGEHAPMTFWAQSIATVETFVAVLYSVLIFGGALSTAMYVENELTPEALTAELRRRLLSLSSTTKIS